MVWRDACTRARPLWWCAMGCQGVLVCCEERAGRWAATVRERGRAYEAKSRKGRRQSCMCAAVLVKLVPLPTPLTISRRAYICLFDCPPSPTTPPLPLCCCFWICICFTHTAPPPRFPCATVSLHRFLSAGQRRNHQPSLDLPLLLFRVYVHCRYDFLSSGGVRFNDYRAFFPSCCCC